jgi:cation:H+ antiporter
MTNALLELLLGGTLLLVGGRTLVHGAVAAAARLRVSPLVVGLTLVAWGTSTPELALNLISAARGRGDLALGNVVGANICNMALVLGACALLRPLVVGERLIRVEIWLNMVVVGLMAAFGLTGGFGPLEAGVLLAIFGAYSMWTVMASAREARRRPTPPPDGTPFLSWTGIAVRFVLGLAFLGIGGVFACDGATGLATGLGVPPAIVGVTVVSIGTTLPELVTGIVAVRRGQTDLAMGNAIGSCLFNTGGIVGLVTLLDPVRSDPDLALALLYMGVLAVLLVPMSRAFGQRVSRLEGAGLLASYAGFLALSAVSVTPS